MPPRTPPVLAMWRRAQSCLLALALSTVTQGAVAQEDDWSITRPDTPSRPSRPHRPRTPRVSDSQTPTSTAARMVDRYLAIVLARADDETAMQRLLEHASHLPEGVRGLEAALQARRSESLNMRLVLAALAHARGDDAVARPLIEEARTLEPERVEPYRLLARIERSASNLEAALSALTSARERAPEDDAIARERAALLMDLNRFDEARAAYEALPHASAWERTEFVRALVARGHCREALPRFDAALSTTLDAASTTTVLLLRARCEDDVSDPEAARASLERALVPARRSGRQLEVLDAMLDLARRRGTLDVLAPQLEAMGDDARASLGMVYEELGRDEDARRIYTQHLARHARDAEIRVRLAHLLARSGALDAAVNERRTLARLFPDRLAFTLELADALAALGRSNEALSVLDAARARGRRDAGVLRRVLDAYSRMGQSDRVLRTLEDLVQQDPSDAARVTALASELIARGEQARAQALIDSLADEETVEAELRAARASLDARLMDAARTHLERAIARAPTSPDVLDASADLYERMGRLSDAQHAIEARLLALDPTDARVHELESRLVASWARGGALAQQLQPLSERASTGDLRALRLLAEVQRRLGDADASLTTLTRLEALSPDDVHVATALQRLHHARHDYDAEVRALRRLVTLEPTRAGWHLSQLVELALSVYRDEDALAFANEAGGRAFNDAQLAIRLGRLEAQRHELDRASVLYRRALEVDPDAHEAAWELASLEEGRGHLEEATRLYATVVERTSDDELRDRAAQAALEAARAGNTLRTLEPRFLALALAHGDSPTHRTPALILYSALLRELEQNDPGSVERVATRALPVLLAGVRDADASHRAMSQSLLLRYPVRGAAAPLLALAASEASELSLRRAAAFAALRVIEAGQEPALRMLLTSVDARLRIAGLHGLARVLSPDAFRTLLSALHEHADLELRAHVAWWSAITTAPGRPIPSWQVQLRDDATLPAATRMRTLALTREPNAAALDWLAMQALSTEGAISTRHPLLAYTSLERACVPHIDVNETLDAWVAHAVAICRAIPRDETQVAEALERAVYALPSNALLSQALTRLADLAASSPQRVELAARALHTRLGASPSLQVAQRDLELIRNVPMACDAACWDRYLAHPSPEIRAAAIAIAPRERALQLGTDAAWLVRRARVRRLGADFDDAAAAVVRAGLSDENLYVRNASLEVLRTHLDAATCALIGGRLEVETSPPLRSALEAAHAPCNTQR